MTNRSHQPEPDWPARAVLAAEAAAESIRRLNHETIRDGYRWPSEVAEVVGELQLVAERLPQALRQAAAWLQTEHGAGRVGHDTAPDAVTAVVAEMLTDLAIAGERAESLAGALRFAHANANHLTGVVDDDRADGQADVGCEP